MTRVADRVAVVSISTGTGPMNLGAALPSYQAWSTAFEDGPVYYGIIDETTGEWEIGLGTLTGPTLTRNSVLSSSNGGAPVSFAAGDKTVYCPEPAAAKTLDMGAFALPFLFLAATGAMIALKAGGVA